MNHIFSLAAELNRQGDKAVVVITGCPPGYRDALSSYGRIFPCFAENRPDEILKLARHYRFDLLHLHDLSLAETAHKLLRSLRLPCGITLHNQQNPPLNLTTLPGLSFLITPYPAAGVPAGQRSKTVFIPEGVDLNACRPAAREGFKIAFIGEESGYTREGATALLEAAGLADIEVQLICPEPLPLLRGRYYGWPLNSAAVLSGAQVVVGRRRGLLEGMACENAALIMGRSYQGLFDPSVYPAALPFPDLSGEGTEPPCYRSIFYDLSALLKDRSQLQLLQQQGRKFVRENCDLRLVTERTRHLYRQVIGR